MRRGDRWVSSQPDYLLARERDRHLFQNVGPRMPRHHDSNHRAVVATIYGGTRHRMAAYRKKLTTFPIKLPCKAPRTEMETAFEPINSWISDATWKLVDHRAMLRKKGELSSRGSRVLNRQVRAALKAPRYQRASKAAEQIEMSLKAGEPKEAWRVLKGWYLS